MTKFLVLVLAFISLNCFAEVDFITVKECRELLFGKFTEDEYLKKVNEKGE